MLNTELYIETSFQQLGSELVANGTFDSDIDWSKGSNWTISSGVASYSALNSGQSMANTNGIQVEIGKTYRLKFTIIGGTARIFWNTGSGSMWVSPNTRTNYPEGSYDILVESVVNNVLEFFVYNDAGGQAFSIDNVSVKEVTNVTDKRRVDMFKDESIQITDSIQNAKDISKVFTAFSMPFTLPASKTNNKIFKYYHDPRVLQGETGVDARFKLSAEIRINGFNYKSGSIKLNDIQLKDNKPYSYSCIFYGEFADLNTTLKDSSLEALDLSSYDHTYDLSTVQDGVEIGLEANGVRSTDVNSPPIIYPLITHTKNYNFDSTAAAGDRFTDDITGDGLEYDQLKPAIQIAEIISAIESKHSITFSTDFIGTTDFAKIYMWLCKNEGAVVSSGKNVGIATGSDIGSVTPTGDDVISYAGDDLILINKFDDGLETQVDWTIEVTSFTGTGNYTLYFEDVYTRKERLFQVYDNNTGGGPYPTYTFSSNVPINQKYYQPRIKVLSDAGITSMDLTVTAVRRLYDSTGVTGTDTGTYVYTMPLLAGEIVIDEQIPTMKVLDFLMGIMKMFNLTAYIKDDGTIYLDTLDEFYALGSDIDITEYVDIKETTVNPPIPYDEIEFGYSNTNYILGKQFNETNNREWGSESYQLEFDIGTGKYEIKAPFEHMLFERLDNEGTTGLSDILMGSAFDFDGNPTSPSAPLLFYHSGIQTLISANAIEWSDGSTSIVYVKSSNVSNALVDGQYWTLNFGDEIEEWSLVTSENSLYKRCYETYIEELYSQTTRLVRVTAYLPASIILTYNLYDRIIIDGRSHKINSIQIDLLDGRTELELITE